MKLGINAGSFGVEEAYIRDILKIIAHLGFKGIEISPRYNLRRELWYEIRSFGLDVFLHARGLTRYPRAT